MTKVTYIHGAPKPPTPPVDEWEGRGQEVPKPSFINYTAMTAGEMKIALIIEQARIIGQFYQDKETLKGAQELENALYRGLHHTPPNSRHDWAQRALDAAKRQTTPAAGNLFGRASMETGIGIIPIEDCRVEGDAWSWTPPGQEQLQQESNYSYSQQCLADNETKRMLNQHLEGASHHVLYEYVSAPNQVPNLVSTKHVLHRNAIGALATVSASSTAESVRRQWASNLKLWIRNGILRNNARNGTEPLQPEETIQILRETSSSPGVGALPAFLVALPAILKAIAAAVAATISLIAVMRAEKQNQIRAAAQGIGTPGFGPERNDWLGAASGAPGTATQGAAALLDEATKSPMLPLLALGAGALFLLR